MLDTFHLSSFKILQVRSSRTFEYAVVQVEQVEQGIMPRYHTEERHTLTESVLVLALVRPRTPAMEFPSGP